MKVYVVTTGEYSDFWVDKIFTTRTMAEAYFKIHNLRYDSGKILEYELLDETTTDIQGTDEYHPWVRIGISTEDGSLLTSEKWLKDILSEKNAEDFHWHLKAPKDIIIDCKYTLHILVQVDKYDYDYDRIMKAAYDIRAKYLAEKLGL